MCLHYIHPDPAPVLVPRTPTCPPASLGAAQPLITVHAVCPAAAVCGPAPWALQSGVLHGTVWVAAGCARQSHWQNGERTTAKQATPSAVGPRAHELWESAGLTMKEKQMDVPFPGNIRVTGRVCRDQVREGPCRQQERGPVSWGGQPDGENCPREPMAAHLPQDPRWTLLKG